MEIEPTDEVGLLNDVGYVQRAAEQVSMAWAPQLSVAICTARI